MGPRNNDPDDPHPWEEGRDPARSRGRQRTRAADADMQVVVDLVHDARRWSRWATAIGAAAAAVVGTIAPITVWFLNESGRMPVTQREFSTYRLAQAQVDLEQAVVDERLGNTLNIMRWTTLDMRRRNGVLTPEEYQEYCNLTRVLQYTAPGCA